MTQKTDLKQKSAAISKTKWLKLALIGTALLIIPRRSSKKSTHIENVPPSKGAD